MPTAHTRVTFAQFMQDALYGADGYYGSGRAQSGKAGDYFTAPDVSPVFGKLLLSHFMEWRKKIPVSPFNLIEVGSGQGALAASIAAALPPFNPKQYDEIRYTAVEASAERQAMLAGRAENFIDKGILFHILPDLQAFKEYPVSGIAFANELIDAFPVHRVRWHNSQLQEGYVESGKLIWDIPSKPELLQYVDRLRSLGIEWPDGYETEINLAMASWLQMMSAALTQGVIVLIDYGRPAHAYYAPERTGGTLRAFSQHRVSNDWLANPGHQDLTADVDFTSLALDAQAAGLEPLAFMEMGSFLTQAVERLGPAAAELPPRALQLLIHPDAMGSAFHVLVLGKGVPEKDLNLNYNRLRRLGLTKET